MLYPWEMSILDGAHALWLRAKLSIVGDTAITGDLDVSGIIQGEVRNNLNAFDMGERILSLMTNPIFLNVMCEDPGAGTMTDISGNGHDGTYTGTWVTAQRLKQGRTWRLNPNGSNNYITMGDHNDFSFGNGLDDSVVTFFGLIEIVDTAGAGVIFSKLDLTGGLEAREYLIDISSTEHIRLVIYDESAAVNCYNVSDAALSVGLHTFVITYDGAGGAAAGDTILIYIDGALVASTATNNASYDAMENTGSSLFIGGRTEVGGSMDNFIDGDFGCLGIDGSEWSAMDVWRFHQLCLMAYSEDGVSL